ncbi:MAG: homocysteine S-methyltransferase family protein [Porticoccaceae bacterium]
MSKYRANLPQLGDSLFLTDGGLETTLVFQDGIELPFFAAFPLLETSSGVERLRRYYAQYLELARQRGQGFVLEAPTWRANPDWGTQLGYDSARLADANRSAIGLMVELRDAYETVQTPIVISGNFGPRGDGYRVESKMTAEQARAYHAGQMESFASSPADMVAAFTLNYIEEAIGIAAAARDARMPVAISFTLETDGCLPSGDSLGHAIRHTDAATGGYPAYYMINCAHPTHFEHVLGDLALPRERIRGLRANASRRSHAELDACADLDAGNPLELGEQYRGLRRRLTQMAVVGGCCGTDFRHVEAISAACA